MSQGPVTGATPVAPSSAPAPSAAISAAVSVARSRSLATRRRPNTAHLLQSSAGDRAGGKSARVTAGRAETALGPGRTGQGGHLTERHLFHALHHELRDPVAAPERDRASRIGVQQDHLDLATVSGVDRARRVDDGDPVPGGQPGARVHERRVPGGQRDRDAGANQRALARRQVHVFGGDQVGAGIAVAGVRRQRHIRVQAGDQHVHTPETTRHYTAAPSSSRSARAALVTAAGMGQATTAPATPATTPPTASTRMTASGCSRTILPTTCGCSRCPSSWFITTMMPKRISAAIQPLVASTTRIASPPATSTPTSGTNAARNMNKASGATSGAPRIVSVIPMTTAWMAATTTVPRT